MSDTKITAAWCEEQARNWSDKADGSALAGWRLPAEQERQLAEVHLLAARALKAREWAQTQLDRLSRVSIATAERFDDGEESACESLLAILDGREP